MVEIENRKIVHHLGGGRVLDGAGCCLSTPFLGASVNYFEHLRPPCYKPDKSLSTIRPRLMKSLSIFSSFIFLFEVRVSLALC